MEGRIITIRIKLFALMAQRAGVRELALSLDAPATLQHAVDRLKTTHPQIPFPPGTMLALNQSFATPDSLLADGDELALIPPVSGG